MLSLLGVFQFGTFKVLLWVSGFSPSVLLRAHLTLFLWCLSILIFCYVLFIPIICSKIVLFSNHQVVGMYWCIHLYFLVKFFSLFWNVQFVLYYSVSVTLCRWSTKQMIPLPVLARNQTKTWARDLWRDRK